jgi:hypothetical protein
MPKLHFLSAAFGFIVAGLLAVTTSQASPPPATLNPAAVRIEYMPHPRDMVQIKEGTSYTVPAGRLLVITALGDATGYFNTPTFNVQLSVNGQVEAAAYYPASVSPSPTVLELAQGLVAKAGDVVAVSVRPGFSSVDARAWGYLASQ